jgi:hypothetical protein
MKYSLEAIRDPIPNVMRVPDSRLKNSNLRSQHLEYQYHTQTEDVQIYLAHCQQ